jgi:hypothetical protein
MSLVTRELCKTVTSGGCIDPKTDLEYKDKTVRCSLLKSGTPGEYLCNQLLGTKEEINVLAKEICSLEPSLPECGSSLSNVKLLLIVAGVVAILIVVLLTRRNR